MDLRTDGASHSAFEVDGSHIPVLPPVNNTKEYYNRKAFYSIMIQALVNHQYRFLNATVGWPGSVHDPQILFHSDIFDKGE